MRNVRFISGAGVSAFLLAACASMPPPVAELAAARTAVSQAKPAGVRHAPQQLRAAQDKLERAQTAMANEEYERARRLAEQAEVDARLAWSMAEAEQAREALAEVQQATQTLKQELQRRTQ